MRIIKEFQRDKKFGKNMKEFFMKLMLSGDIEFKLDPLKDITVFLANLGLILPINF